MARKKVKHAMIPNERVRKSTLKRRVNNLFKKAHELSTLCNIEMLIILLDRKEGDLTMWPSQDKAINGISKFLAFPEQERLKKMVLQEKLLTKKIQDMSEQTSNLRLKNDETEMRILMKQVIDGKSFDVNQINVLNHLIEENLIRLRRRSDELDEMQRQSLGKEGNQGDSMGNSNHQE